MGQPIMLKTWYPACGKLTQGTETSKYLEEKKTKVISLVVASEKELAQTI
jgi:tRNA uridine 5-carbamoylmethylation protein Kti12